MAADYSIKANDRLPSIQATLTNSDGSAIDLTDATGVAFLMRLIGGTVPKIDAPAVVVNAAFGIVRYDWLAADTDTPGNYHAEWEITWASGKQQTVPTLTYHTVDVLDDLNGA